MSHILALPSETVLADDYRIERVLGAGGFGITYLATEEPLGRRVTLKEYFPADFAHRLDNREAVPRSACVAEDYQWGLDRFISEAQTLARFDHPNIVKVYRYFQANNTAYMVLHFEEGQSLKGWLKALGRAPRQRELDDILKPLLDALETIHAADFLHRDIAPDNIIIRKDGSPVLIDFGSARGEIAQHSRTLSALVKPGYSPYEQYAETGHRQGPWTDIYALAATLYHAVSGKRPADAPSRVVNDTLAPAREVAISSYRVNFLAAIDRALALDIDARPVSIRAWRGDLLAPDPKRSWLKRTLKTEPKAPAAAARPMADVLPPVPDAPGQQGGFLDFVDGLKKKPSSGGGGVEAVTAPAAARAAAPASLTARLSQVVPAPAKAAPPHAAAVPAVAPAVAERAKARPRPVKTRSSIRPLLFKLAIGAGIASVVVAFQDQLVRPAPEPTTKVARTESSQPVRPANEARVRTSDIETRSLPATPPRPVSPPAASTPAPAVASMAPAASVPTTAATPAPPAAVRISAHRGGVLSAQFAGDGRSVVTLGQDGLLRAFVLETGVAQRTIDLSHEATSLAVVGRKAAVGHADGSVTVHDLDTGEQTSRLPEAAGLGTISAIAFAGPERLLATSNGGGVAAWDLKLAARAGPLHGGHDQPVQAVAAHPRGATFVTGGRDGTIRIWDPARADAIRTVRGNRAAITALAYAPDGRVIAAASADGTVRLWSATTGRLQRVLRGPQVPITAIAYSPAGDLLATAWQDGVVRLTGTGRWRTVETLATPGVSPRSITFSPDGRYVAAGTSDGAVTAWSAIFTRSRDGD
jgi:hypothetical protein